MSIDEALNVCFKDQPITYRIIGKHITLEPQVKSVKQQKGYTLTGKITNEAGIPLERATVQVIGTNQKTYADQSGMFTLKDISGSETIQISMVGYENVTIPIQGRHSLDIVLKLKTNTLNEKVVIAYGTTTQRTSTGNIAVVKAADIEKQPVTNPLLALQGRVPGLFITQSTGFANSGVTVRIQGQNSIGNGNDPFYVVDGVPFSATLLPSLSGILGSSGLTPFPSGAGNPFSFINPSDIESITVLKDADATAIYGSRAANGAILITTKKGQAGQTKVNIQVQRGWGKVAKKIKLLNTKQYLEMRHEAFANDGITPGGTDYDINGTWDTTRYTDWQKELIGGTAQYTDVHASISGGNSSTKFLVGTGYHKETTVFPGEFADRKGSVRLNLEHSTSNQKFKIQFSGSYLIDDNHIMSDDQTMNAMSLAPNAPSLRKTDGSLNWAPISSGDATWQNPLANLLRSYNNNTNNLVGNSLLSYQLLKGLYLKASLGYNHLENSEYFIVPKNSLSPQEGAENTSQSLFSNSTLSTWITEPQATYNYQWKKSNVDILAGMTFTQSTNNSSSFIGSGYTSDELLTNLNAAASITPYNRVNSIYKYTAVYGRINYNFSEKYLINLSIRRDGSTRFGKKNKFHSFGAIGIGWVFSNESWIKDILPKLSFGKLRGSFGITGSDQIGDYQFLSIYTTPFGISNPYQGISGLLPNGLSNPYLKWEETKKFQGGIDLGFLQDRILINLTYFNNRTSNQLLLYNLPITTGVTNISTNFPAIVQNYGYELSLLTINIKNKNFQWTSSFNLTIPKNKLVRFDKLELSSYAADLIIGQPINMERAYQFEGVNPETGLYQILSYENGEGKLTSSPDYSFDRKIFINTSPKLYGGIQNSFTYKTIQLDLAVQFVKQTGRNIYYGIGLPGTFSGMDNRGNQPSYVLDRWRETDKNKSIQKYSTKYDTEVYQAFDGAYNGNSSYSDASFIRIKNVSLSWQIPLPSKWKISCRVIALGQNLLTITKYKGLDPETRSSNTLPPLRVITCGIQATL
ncbi:hypothetical protein BW716_06125 [[Flexibacter] sp. ATCC 35208]|nr:hypothetical protein BW716_06125 [[Flexibacter] sp. ATCC 35208]